MKSSGSSSCTRSWKVISAVERLVTIGHMDVPRLDAEDSDLSWA